ncbi:MAG: RHS repeat-associated core domain-containing protein [Chloroflexi bacterium]|nr:RHS repeat-associated core domain-containing protein [Chloroflexota bacterium]
MAQRNQPYQTTIFLGKLYEDDTVYDVKKQYLFGGKLVALREGLDAASDVSFILIDHLGSTTTTLWADGSARSHLRYNPWGEERWNVNVSPTGTRFTGQRWDEGLGLYDYNARYYDPEIGRFISADTIIPGQERLTPLAVGFHETQFLERSNVENQQLLLCGSSFAWSKQQQQELNIPTGH